MCDCVFFVCVCVFFYFVSFAVERYVFVVRGRRDGVVDVEFVENVFWFFLLVLFICYCCVYVWRYDVVIVEMIKVVVWMFCDVNCCEVFDYFVVDVVGDD